MKLHAVVFCLCAGLCSSALIENAFSMKGSEKFGDKDSHQAMVVGQYSESNYNSISIKPEDLKSYPNLQTLHLYTREDIKNWAAYKPDEKFIDQLPSGNLKNANGLFYKVEIHVPYNMEEIKKYNLLDSMKDKFIYSTSTAKYPIRFRDVSVHQAADIGHVDPETGQFIFNDDIYTGYNNEEIEKSDNSYVIRDISNDCFKGFSSLKSIIIPNSVESIGWHPFYGCASLENVIIPDSVTYISPCVFTGCTSLKNVIIPDSVTYISTSAFKGCTSLENVIIPDSVKDIDDCAFEKCENLQNVTIGSNVETISWHAFCGCTSLGNVIIPDSVKDIKDEAFLGCTKTKFTVPYNGMKKFLSLHHGIDDSMITVDEKADQTNAWIWPENGELKFPDGLKSIDYNMFSNRKDITTVIIPDSVKRIKDRVFRYCNNLRKVTIGNNVETIGFRAFSECENLQNLTIGNNVKTIDTAAFVKCTSLKNVIIPDSVTHIGAHAFAECENLQNLTIGNNVKTIGTAAFGKCTSLKNVIIPDSVTSIRDFAFFKCENLQNVTIGNGVTSIGERAFLGCTGLTSIVIPDSVTEIGDYAFYGCNKLNKIYVYSDRVKQLITDSKSGIDHKVIEIIEKPKDVADDLSILSDSDILKNISDLETRIRSFGRFAREKVDPMLDLHDTNMFDAENAFIDGSKSADAKRRERRDRRNDASNIALTKIRRKLFDDTDFYKGSQKYYREFLIKQYYLYREEAKKRGIDLK